MTGVRVAVSLVCFGCLAGAQVQKATGTGQWYPAEAEALERALAESFDAADKRCLLVSCEDHDLAAITHDQIAAGETVTGHGERTQNAVILRDPQTGVFSIEDLESSNGTKVNGKRVRSAELCHNDEITLGETVFHFLEAGLPVDPDLRPGRDDDDTLAFTTPPDPTPR